MISKAISEINEADLISLVEQRREEGPQLDFKRDLPKDDHDGQKAFFSDVCAFANTSGGDLIYGIDEKEGVASMLTPQDLPMSVDNYVLKLTSSIRDRIEPQLHGVQIQVVPTASIKHCLVIRVPRSFSGIHRYKKDGQFYVRKSRSNEALDVPGIVSRISDRLGREDRLSTFFARRYADILTDSHALAVAPGPKLVVHLLPVRDFLSGEEVDLNAIPENSLIPFLSDLAGYSSRNVFDGKAYFDASGDTTSAFTLFMRSGVVEGCMDLIGATWPAEYKKIQLGFVEESVLLFLSRFQAGRFADKTTGTPYVVKVALLGTNGLPFLTGHSQSFQFGNGSLPIRQTLPVLALPDVLVESAENDFDHEMHSSFVRMWHAWGIARSPFYQLQHDKWVRLAR